MKIILISVVSLDGKIAKQQKDPIDWASKEDRRFFVQETKKAGVVLMGKNTFEMIGKILPGRLNIVFTSQTLNLKPRPGILEYTNQTPEQVIKNLTKKGFKKAMLIGGSRLNASFLEKGLIDEIWLTLEGLIFGQGLSLFEKGSYNLPARLLSFQKLGKNSLLLKYQILKT